MENSGGHGARELSDLPEGPEGHEAGDRPAGRTGWTDRTLAAGVAAGLERLIGLFRSLSPPSGLSLTAAATLATLERSGPRRLTSLAVQEGVTQPAMTQLIARLQDSGLVRRDADPADGRVVQVRLTDQGREMLALRRAALAAALPAIDALASAQRDGGSLAAPLGTGRAEQFT